MFYPNNTLEVIRNRTSCRNFLNKEIPDDVLNQILDAGISAPSGSNIQPFSIIKITDPAKKKKLAAFSQSYNRQSFIEKAPIALLFCIDFHRVKQMADITPFPMAQTENLMDFWLTLCDIAMCAQNMCIAAESLGIKSVYIGNILWYLREITEMCKLPSYVCPAFLMCLGYPAQKKKPMKKYSRDVIVHDEVYQSITNEKLISAFNDHFNNWKKPVTPESLQLFKEHCIERHGVEFAEKACKSLTDSGNFNYYQYFIGIFYKESDDMMKNPDFKEYMKEQGFGWLE